MSKPKRETTPDAALAKKRRTVGLIIQSVLLLIAILVYLYFTAQNYIIDCQKDDEGGIITCTMRMTVLSLITVEKQTVTGMAAAAVEDECQGASCKYRLELYDNQGVAHPVREQYTPNNVVKDRVAKLLNQFVTDPDRVEISLREQVDWLVFMLPLTAIGAFVIYRLSLGKPGK